MKDALLIILAKYPEVGQVKTRLARDMGPERACVLYGALLRAVLSRTQPEPADPFQRLVCYAPPTRGAAMRDFLEKDCEYYGPLAPQAEGDLGEKMQQAFARAFAEGFRRVVMIGADAPLIHRPRVLESLERLRSVGVVLGPSSDGGYYLIGLASPARALFDKVPWSTDQVLTRTVAKVEQQGLSYFCLPEESDVDDLAGWQRLKIALEALPAADRIGLEGLWNLMTYTG